MNVPQFSGSFNLKFNPKPPKEDIDAIKASMLRVYAEIPEDDPQKALMMPWGEKSMGELDKFLPDHIQINCSPEHDEKILEGLQAMTDLYRNPFSEVVIFSKSEVLNIDSSKT